MDLSLSLLEIGSNTVIPTKKFIRIEVEPRTRANSVVSAAPPHKSDCIAVGGIVVVDTDRDFLEIHPDTVYSKIATADAAKSLQARALGSVSDSASRSARCVPR
jgi:hypothetical protein